MITTTTTLTTNHTALTHSLRVSDILESDRQSQLCLLKVEQVDVRYSGVSPSVLQVNMYKDKRLTFLILIYSVSVRN